MSNAKSNEPAAISCRPLSEFESKNIEWLWKGRIPLGCVTLLEGDGGTGKSFVAAAIASALSSGNALPDDIASDPINILLMAAEDDPNVVLRPRCEALGANLARIYFAEDQFLIDSLGAGKIRDMVINNDLKLVIIDPIVSFLGTKIDTSSATDVRSVIKPLHELAAEFQISILIVRHWNKSAQSSASMRGSGSVDFRNAARSSLQVIRDGHDHYLTLEKSNYGATGKTLTFQIESNNLKWTGRSDLLADDILNRQRGTTEEDQKLAEAEQYLREVLANDPQPAVHMRETAEQSGISKRTLERAKKSLRVRSIKEGDGWLWSLGNSSAPD